MFRFRHRRASVIKLIIIVVVMILKNVEEKMLCNKDK